MPGLKKPSLNPPAAQKGHPRIDLPIIIVLGVNLLLVLFIGAVIVMPPRAIQNQSGVASAQGLPQNDLALQPILASSVHAAGEDVSIINLPIMMVSTGNGATGLDALSDPAVLEQGGTCISGYVINVYHQRVGIGWDVTVTRLAPTEGTPVTKKVDANGDYYFGNLGAGTYRVHLSVPDTYREFTPSTFEVTLNGTSTICAQTRFKVEALACLRVTKLDDHGYMDFRERVGLPGWPITLKQGSTTLSEITNGVGVAEFLKLVPGLWTVSEEIQVGWEPVTDSPAQRNIELVSPRDPSVCTEITFVNQQLHTSCIAVEKKNDLGRPLDGWTMTLTRKDGTRAPRTAITGPDGRAYFLDLELGEWIVKEELREWWKPATVTMQTINLEEPSVSCVLVEFVNNRTGGIDGYKINHYDEGLANWEIWARNAETGEEYMTRTDRNGYFEFHGLTLGTWIVSETVEAESGWTAVTPSEFKVEVTVPFEYVHVRFKNRTEYACIDVYKRDAWDGVGLPGWLINVQPAFGGTTQTGETDGTGWVRFNKLPPGTYDVAEMLNAGWLPVGPSSSTITVEATGTCAVVTFYNRQENSPEVTIPNAEGDVAGDPAAPPAPEGCPCVYYTVQRGDTLYAISQRFGVSVQAIQEANHLANANLIYAGTTLCIPPK